MNSDNRRFVCTKEQIKLPALCLNVDTTLMFIRNTDLIHTELKELQNLVNNDKYLDEGHRW